MVKSPLRHRPRTVAATAWLVIFFCVINLWRAAGLGRQRTLLRELGASVEPAWLLVAAVVWAALFAGAAVALWQGRSFSRLAVPAAMLAYALYQLAVTTGLARSDMAQEGWPAAALLYALTLLFMTWALNRPAAISYFNEKVATSRNEVPRKELRS